MGGLVIKRAYILAKQRPDLRWLADRVKAIVFLATPHRGADLAHVFSKLLSLSGGARPYVEDLHRNSLATESINEEFPYYCQDLRLVSFYETLPTIGRSLIVEKDQATLGYANEQREYLNANHREVCKFTSERDSNYRTVRDALASILNEVQGSLGLSRQKIEEGKRRQLNTYLGLFDTPEDDLLTADSLRMGGSCEWLIKKSSFQDWLNCFDSPIYWILGKPAAGKTVLASKVITHLRKLDKSCSFYFFHHGNKGISNISSFLLSIARQMALADGEVMNAVLRLFEDEDRLSKADYKSIWRKLFLDAIFKVKLDETQYWVIDALDECTNEPEMAALFTKTVEVYPVRILLTSRNQFETCLAPGLPQAHIHSEQILEEDSKSDITLYLEANISRLPSVDASSRRKTLLLILEKSAGCFLWVSLVFQELVNVRTSTEVAKVLATIPTDMNGLFARILDNMSAASYGKKLAQAILIWSTCCIRPLKTAELHDVLEIDMNERVDNDIDGSIRSCCGQLVYVDAQSHVQMIHLTAQDFLLHGEIESEFAVEEKSGHRRLLLACLAYLNSDELKGLRRRRPGGSSAPRKRSPFVSYASNFMFEHLSHATLADPETLSALAKFFGSTNVLSWIEYIAGHSDLNRLIQTGKALNRITHEKWDANLKSSNDMMLLQSWATDLVQLVMKFGRNLAASPSTIFDLIPPFCPPVSAIWRQFGCTTRGIKICGLRAESWDDCLSTIVNPHEQFSSLACSKSFFAVGTYRGKITLYNQITCQEMGGLQQDEPVRMLMFGRVSQVLVSTGFKNIYVWNLETKELQQTLGAPQQTMALALSDDDQTLLGALKDHRLKSWDLRLGSLTENVDWTQGLEEMTKLHYRRPVTAAFGIDAKLLAVIYKGQDILLWDLESDSLYDTYSRERGADSIAARPYGSAGVRCLCFGAGDTADLLCAAYGDGELVLFDTSTGAAMSRITAFAHVLICSPDGSTLASADPSGTIQLFRFDTLELLYRINSVEPGIQDLAFSGDSLRLLDIRTSRCRVWEPTVLLGRHIDGGSTRFSASETAPEIISLDSTENRILITSIVSHPDGAWLFCGKEDGSVHLCDTKTVTQTLILFSHAPGVAIANLNFEAESQTLTSIDSSSRIMIHRIKHQGHSMAAEDLLIDQRADFAVSQLICKRGLGRILLCSAKCNVLWSVSDGNTSGLNSIELDEDEPYRWSSHPTNSDHLILVTRNTAHIFDWNTLERITSVDGILLEGSILPELTIRAITPCFSGSMLATTFSESLAPYSESKLILWNTSDFNTGSKKASPVPNFHQLADHVELLIGSTTATDMMQANRLVFLHRNNWVCSADLLASKAEQYVRHFFFPADWLSANAESIIKVTAQGDIVLVKKDEVAVIKRGLLVKESVGLSAC